MNKRTQKKNNKHRIFFRRLRKTFECSKEMTICIEKWIKWTATTTSHTRTQNNFLSGKKWFVLRFMTCLFLWRFIDGNVNYFSYMKMAGKTFLSLCLSAHTTDRKVTPQTFMKEEKIINVNQLIESMIQLPCSQLIEMSFPHWNPRFYGAYSFTQDLCTYALVIPLWIGLYMPLWRSIYAFRSW